MADSKVEPTEGAGPVFTMGPSNASCTCTLGDVVFVRKKTEALVPALITRDPRSGLMFRNTKTPTLMSIHVEFLSEPSHSWVSKDVVFSANLLNAQQLEVSCPPLR